MSGRKESRGSRTPAEVYDEYFVPALFQQWASVLAGLAEIRPDDRVLDVACGTGVLALAVADRVGSGGSVVGLEPNDEMLAVARRKRAAVEWRSGRAESIPFPAESFDAVVSQFGMMFFDDRVAALREMMRVLRSGGRMVVAVCGSLDDSPGYAALARLLSRLFGEGVAEAFRAPFVLGDAQRLHSLCAEARVESSKVGRHDGVVRFASIESVISTERACVWTLGGLLDDAQFALLLREAEKELAPFLLPDGTVEFGMPALIATATKP